MPRAWHFGAGEELGGSPQRFYSMSAQIRAGRNGYYAILETSRKGDRDVTAWMTWFLSCLRRAVDGADGVLSSVLGKARFWEAHGAANLNERQIKVINRLLDGFEGRLTSSRWARLTRSSQDTASRDIADLVRLGILHKSEAGGRSTHYDLVPP